jgi:hypothetical protein
METNKGDKFKFIDGGRDEFEGTNEFAIKVGQIRKELKDKYSPELSNERSWVRRLLLKIKLEIEISKRIRALSSLKNLHAIYR